MTKKPFRAWNKHNISYIAVAFSTKKKGGGRTKIYIEALRNRTCQVAQSSIFFLLDEAYTYT